MPMDLSFHFLRDRAIACEWRRGRWSLSQSPTGAFDRRCHPLRSLRRILVRHQHSSLSLGSPTHRSSPLLTAPLPESGRGRRHRCRLLRRFVQLSELAPNSSETTPHSPETNPNHPKGSGQPPINSDSAPNNFEQPRRVPTYNRFKFVVVHVEVPDFRRTQDV
ncbi:uncharacterized protein LOC121767342 [Salvia splendens]|uniref:uncharacterized protein LOC121767342 n=1 Tax=Salvia splendens TaxID=180675 RepID=UPI001C272F01|nr:uncharacterized protein LOC121767342 [Salvia splendens]